MVVIKGVKREVERHGRATVVVTMTESRARDPEHPLRCGTVIETKDCPAPNASGASMRNIGHDLKIKMNQRGNKSDLPLSPRVKH